MTSMDTNASAARGLTLWLTGLSGAGKTTLATVVARHLRAAGHRVEVLDGDEVRTHLSKGLGFSKEDRDTNVQRIGYVCRLLSRNGVIAIAAAISPYRAARDAVRAAVSGDGAAFVEVYVRCSLDALVQRDTKGLYARALAGKLPNFTGVNDPYEAPVAPQVVVDTDRETVEMCAGRILGAVEAALHAGWTRSRPAAQVHSAVR